MNKKYTIAMEIEGNIAYFSNPSSGGGFNTYLAPTFSACKGMMENILLLSNAVAIPYRVEICRPIRTYEIKYNYQGLLRKPDLFQKMLLDRLI